MSEANSDRSLVTPYARGAKEWLERLLVRVDADGSNLPDDFDQLQGLRDVVACNTTPDNPDFKRYAARAAQTAAGLCGLDNIVGRDADTRLAAAALRQHFVVCVLNQVTYRWVMDMAVCETLRGDPGDAESWKYAASVSDVELCRRACLAVAGLVGEECPAKWDLAALTELSDDVEQFQLLKHFHMLKK